MGPGVELAVLFLAPHQLQAIIAGLQELPWKVAQPVLQEIQRQLDGRAKAAQEPKEGEPPGEVVPG